MKDTTSPQVPPSNGAARATIAAHCCGEVLPGMFLAAKAFQSNGSLGFCKVWSEKSLRIPAPAVTGSNDTLMLPWKPGGSVPNGPAGLKPNNCNDELE